MPIEMAEEKVQAFDSFVDIYKILVIVGYYKPLNTPKYRFLIYLNIFYRIMVFLVCVVIYNLQHLIYIVMEFENKNMPFDSLIVEIPHLNLIAKILAINFATPKLERLRRLMSGDPLFAPDSDKDEEDLRKNRDRFKSLVKVSGIAVTISAIAWTMSPIVNKMNDLTVVPASYFPFETNSTIGFAMAILLEHGPVMWVGYGHIALDLLIACYYAQALVQLRIIRNNLQEITKTDKKSANVISNDRQNRQYIDEFDPKVHERFVNCVKRYGKVVWFVNEVNSVFGRAISCQFFSSSCCICLVIYKMTKISPASIPFIFLVALIVILQAQVFVYCYCGEHVKYESTFVVDSVYQCEWLSLSPRFRKQLLIAMSRWGIPITPKVSDIVPLSLTTYISIIRAALNLYTVLKKTN